MLKVTVVWPNGASIKSSRNTGGASSGVFSLGDSFLASEIVSDSLDPSNPDKLWAVIAEGSYFGKFVAVRYPSTSGNPVRAAYEYLPTGEVVLTHTINVYSDGSIEVDGIPY